MDTQSESKIGINQGDLIVRTAIIAGIADLRANTWILDYIMPSLPKDTLTSDSYGQSEVNTFKNWFLSTNIPVYSQFRMDTATYPCISVTTLEIAESDNTLGDKNYETSIEAAGWPNLTDPFDAQAWDASTNTLTIPDSIANSFIFSANQNIIDRNGNVYAITQVKDYNKVVLSNVKAGADLSGLNVRGINPSFIVQMESAIFKETYGVACWAVSDVNELYYLRSLITFILLRYRQKYLEGRNFQLSSLVAAAPAKQNLTSGSVETLWYWPMTLTGKVMYDWPKDFYQKPTVIEIQPRVAGAGALYSGQNVDLMAWVGDKDNFITLENFLPKKPNEE